MALAYLLAVLFPPAAVFLAGKKGAIIINVVLCFLGWIPAVIHALMVVSSPGGKRRFLRNMERFSEDNGED